MTEYVVTGPKPGMEREGHEFDEEALRGIAEDTDTTDLPVSLDQSSGPTRRVGTVEEIYYDDKDGLVIEVEITDDEVEEKINGEVVDVAPVLRVPAKITPPEERDDPLKDAYVTSVGVYVSTMDGVGIDREKGQSMSLSEYLE